MRVSFEAGSLTDVALAMLAFLRDLESSLMVVRDAVAGPGFYGQGVAAEVVAAAQTAPQPEPEPAKRTRRTKVEMEAARAAEAAQTAAASPVEQAAAATAVEQAPAPAQPKAEPKTFEDVKLALTRVVEKPGLGVNAGKEILAQFNVQRLTALKEDDFAAFIAECVKRVEA